MNTFLQRSLSGLVLAAVMIGMILASTTTLFILSLSITAASMFEFYRLVSLGSAKKGGAVNFWAPILIGCAMVTLTYAVVWRQCDPACFLGVVPALFLLFVAQLYRKNGIPPSRRIALKLMGIIYIAVPMSLFLLLGADMEKIEPDYNRYLVLFYIILIWINDVGAYLVGVSIGKHRLFERISPKKSWEGFFGGLVFTVLASVFLGPRMTGWENTPFWAWIIFGVVLTLSAVAGDLIESLLKREAGVKDSGTIIPGHGGFLDRFDALFVSLPFVYLLVRLMA